ncbi:hypothetical protein [Chroococcus sp. FPU101]|uniref:hypothetical protein n=1 Tax=Chroococcus sp. FPU101 TaxID=1974212 RepID=UPI001A8E1FD4|nr:hypothetical protein [Chroococcus sp. FPU101]GFE69479.1 hypothetical protein CFPU101_20890 [Chroococcus sp. FPU101]
MTCNRNKGSDVGFIVMPHDSSVFSRFYNPRIDSWHEHFMFNDSDLITILPLSPIGEVTVRILKFNSVECLQGAKNFA